MTCRDIRKRMAMWARAANRGGGAAEEREALAAHLSACPVCAEELRLLALKRILLQATRAPEAEPMPSLYARVSARLREERVRPVFSFWEAARAFAASVAVVAMILLMLLVGVNVYIHRQIPAERRDFISALMERNFSEAERLVFAGEELSQEGVLSALAAEPQGSR
ncbi:MAG: hypothetical protein N0A16_02845 [Blastocatellia bacterium]|nr:hypothetical protein [Blastocatellia bacterium]MCS7156653.1 hypothetical protein [Blastocatellia bacterium]MCX7751605.1 hypothetical protein [Blastocatellia bacterium]MDW8168705.1 hypothetical protein [Acidobacteriota bacterium]MDW8256971.1 hypothetical protein [Acidobacteriota bacterium]